MRARPGVVRLHGTQKGYGMDEIKDYLDRLSDLSDGEIADLEGRILSNFDKVEKEDPTRETVDAMTGLASIGSYSSTGPPASFTTYNN